MFRDQRYGNVVIKIKIVKVMMDLETSPAKRMHSIFSLTHHEHSKARARGSVRALKNTDIMTL